MNEITEKGFGSRKTLFVLVKNLAVRDVRAAFVA